MATVGQFTDALRVPQGSVDLTNFPTGATPGFDGSKKEAEADLKDLGKGLIDLQTKLFAEGRTGKSRNLLLILQGMDTSGKGGVLVKTVGLMDPQGIKVTSFKAPTEEERQHDFLWRIKNALPEPGIVAVFDRSHYEDVLIQRVRAFAAPDEIERRYGAINEFEAELSANGTTVIKCMLHISKEQQLERLRARLEDPTKYWKYNPGDIDERQLWSAYQEAYEIALTRTNTDAAPWHIIPSDQKWYRNLAVGHLLHEALQCLDPDWPAPDFDLAVELARLDADTISGGKG